MPNRLLYECDVAYQTTNVPGIFKVQKDKTGVLDGLFITTKQVTKQLNRSADHLKVLVLDEKGVPLLQNFVSKIPEGES